MKYKEIKEELIEAIDWLYTEILKKYERYFYNSFGFLQKNKSIKKALTDFEYVILNHFYNVYMLYHIVSYRNMIKNYNDGININGYDNNIMYHKRYKNEIKDRRVVDFLIEMFCSEGYNLNLHIDDEFECKEVELIKKLLSVKEFSKKGYLHIVDFEDSEIYLDI